MTLNPGIAVGTEFVPHLIPFPAEANLTKEELQEAASIYAFDLLTQNPDRTRNNPNCGRAGSRLVPYDFETAFSFRFAILRVDAWNVSRLPFARQHLFHTALRRAPVDWQSVWDRFASTPTPDLADVCSTIPKEWTEIGVEVRDHLAAVREHWSAFTSDVSASLGNSV